MRILLTCLTLCFLCLPTAVFACGPSSNCSIDDGRFYRIRMPAGHDGKAPVGAIVFAHSLGATASGTMRNPALKAMANRLGIALIAAKSVADDWNIKNSPANRSARNSNEFKYFDDVIRHATKRFAIDPKKIVLAGASVGGTMTWTMACQRGDRFAGFIPVAGTYWLRPPKSCSSRSTNIIHIHGTSDRTVPLEGRRVGTSRHSNIRELHAAYAKIGRYRKTSTSKPIDLTCTHSENDLSKILDLCLHSGGHSFHARHIEFAWKRFQKLGIL